MRIGTERGRGLPGLNAVIRAVVHKGVLHYGDQRSSASWRAGAAYSRPYDAAQHEVHERDAASRRDDPALFAHQREEDPGGFEKCLAGSFKARSSMR